VDLAGAGDCGAAVDEGSSRSGGGEDGDGRIKECEKEASDD